MAATTYLCVKNDKTVWVVTFDTEKNTCQLLDVYSWVSGKPAEADGKAVSAWAEQNSPNIEAIYPFDESTRTADFNDSAIIEVSELMDDIRDF